MITLVENPVLTCGNDLVAAMWGLHKAQARAQADLAVAPRVNVREDRVQVSWSDSQQAWDALVAAGGTVDGDVVWLALPQGILTASRVTTEVCSCCGRAK